MTGKLIIRAYDKDNYFKDILVVDEQQIRMKLSCIEEGIDGIRIDPSTLSEMEYFR